MLHFRLEWQVTYISKLLQNKNQKAGSGQSVGSEERRRREGRARGRTQAADGWEGGGSEEAEGSTERWPESPGPVRDRAPRGNEGPAWSPSSAGSSRLSSLALPLAAGWRPHAVPGQTQRQARAAALTARALAALPLGTSPANEIDVPVAGSPRPGAGVIGARADLWVCSAGGTESSAPGEGFADALCFISRPVPREPSMPCVTAPTCTAGGWCWSGRTPR